jgi:uncharacterized membrane protein YhhN
MKKYLISLSKYILGVVLFLALIVIAKLYIPNGSTEFTKNQALVFIVVSIILMAAAIKSIFD